MLCAGEQKLASVTTSCSLQYCWWCATERRTEWLFSVLEDKPNKSLLAHIMSLMQPGTSVTIIRKEERKRKNRERIIINHNYCIVHKHLFFNVLTSFFPSFPWLQMLCFKLNATKQKYRCQQKYMWPSWSSIPSTKRWAIKGNCLVHGKLKHPDVFSVYLYLLFCLRKLGNTSFTQPFSTFFSDTLQRTRFFSGKWSDGSNDLIDSWWGN